MRIAGHQINARRSATSGPYEWDDPATGTEPAAPIAGSVCYAWFKSLDDIRSIDRDQAIRMPAPGRHLAEAEQTASQEIADAGPTGATAPTGCPRLRRG